MHGEIDVLVHTVVAPHYFILISMFQSRDMCGNIPDMFIVKINVVK